MEFIKEYGVLIILAVIILALAAYFIIDFFKKPTSEQLKQVKEWLLFAVSEAEKAFGSGTGQLKLRYVYDQFLSKFPLITTLITFDKFSALVDEALEKMKELLATNTQIKSYIQGKEEE